MTGPQSCHCYCTVVGETNVSRMLENIDAGNIGINNLKTMSEHCCRHRPCVESQCLSSVGNVPRPSQINPVVYGQLGTTDRHRCDCRHYDVDNVDICHRFDRLLLSRARNVHDGSGQKILQSDLARTRNHEQLNPRDVEFVSCTKPHFYYDDISSIQNCRSHEVQGLYKKTLCRHLPVPNLTRCVPAGFSSHMLEQDQAVPHEGVFCNCSMCYQNFSEKLHSTYQKQCSCGTCLVPMHTPFNLNHVPKKQMCSSVTQCQGIHLLEDSRDKAVNARKQLVFESSSAKKDSCGAARLANCERRSNVHIATQTPCLSVQAAKEKKAALQMPRGLRFISSNAQIGRLFPPLSPLNSDDEDTGLQSRVPAVADNCDYNFVQLAAVEKQRGDQNLGGLGRVLHFGHPDEAYAKPQNRYSDYRHMMVSDAYQQIDPQIIWCRSAKDESRDHLKEYCQSVGISESNFDNKSMIASDVWSGRQDFASLGSEVEHFPNAKFSINRHTSSHQVVLPDDPVEFRVKMCHSSVQNSCVPLDNAGVGNDSTRYQVSMEPDMAKPLDGPYLGDKFRTVMPVDALLSMDFNVAIPTVSGANFGLSDLGNSPPPYSEKQCFANTEYQPPNKALSENSCIALHKKLENSECTTKTNTDIQSSSSRNYHVASITCEKSGEEPIISMSSPKPERKLQAIKKQERVRYYPAFFKLYMEQHVENVMKSYYQRLQRRQQLEEEMEKLNLPEAERKQCRSWLFQKESHYLRQRRTRLDKSLFETITILGRGAFGDVSLVRRRDSNALYAMKTLVKEDILRQKQLAHVKAERDLLAEADSEWVVKLYYSFQDSDCLYFVMEYVAGGDLMGLLMKLKVFTHEMARFYTAELVLAIESVHKLGYIHRDIKPDNILIGLNGHLKLTDFGLCTGFHWSHSSDSYVADVEHLKNDSSVTKSSRHRHVAKSLVGTPNYIAPEVLLQSGYTSCCDWWSVGVIVYEMLVGHPPFVSSNSLETQLRVVYWRSTLKIPKSSNLSPEAIDIILRLCCDQSDRLGRFGADQVKGHSFFKEIDFETLHKQTAPHIPQIAHPLDTSNFEAVEQVRPQRTDTIGKTSALDDSASCDDTKFAFLDFTFRRFFDGDVENAQIKSD